MPASANNAQLDQRETKGIDTCTTCPKLCRWACPVAETESRETVSPHALVVLSGLVKREIAPIEAQADLPYHCSHCFACTEACLHKNDVPLLLSLARNRTLMTHQPPPRVSEMRGHFGIAGNPQGTALDGVLAQISEDSDVALARSAKSIYFPGCETLAHFTEASTAFLRASLLFGWTGVAVTPLSASCCGAALFFAGDIEGFRMHAERFAQQARDADTLIVHDAACAHTMKHRYKDVGVTMRPEIKHVSEIIADKVARPQTGGETTVAYADTCALARGLGIVEEPRAILNKIFEGRTIELAGLSGREADCCGASGLLPLTAPATARAMGEAKIAAFRESGADELATFSPRCAAHLRSIEPSLRVVDVAMLLARL